MHNDAFIIYWGLGLGLGLLSGFIVSGLHSLYSDCVHTAEFKNLPSSVLHLLFSSTYLLAIGDS